jgi:hypothetical protein
MGRMLCSTAYRRLNARFASTDVAADNERPVAFVRASHCGAAENGCAAGGLRSPGRKREWRHAGLVSLASRPIAAAQLGVAPRRATEAGEPADRRSASTAGAVQGLTLRSVMHTST